MSDQSSLAPCDEKRADGCDHRQRKRNKRHRSDALPRFTSSLSHDLRTPLAVIQEHAALLRDGLVGAINVDQMRILDVIADRASDINTVLDTALDAARLASGTLELWRRRTSVRSVFQGIRPRLQRKAATKTVALQFDLPRDLPDIYCDTESVGRAIAHAAVSAINLSSTSSRILISADFSPHCKEVTIEICVEEREAAANPVFAALQCATEGKVGGPGRLSGHVRDLSITREVVERNFGRFEIATGVGGATRFKLGLPINDSSELFDRQLNWIQKHRICPSPISLLLVKASDTVDDDLLDDTNSFLNLMAKRYGLNLSISAHCWAIIVFQRRTTLARFIRTLDQRRETINEKRLGLPLPPLIVMSLGSWTLPDGIPQIRESFQHAVQQHAPLQALT